MFDISNLSPLFKYVESFNPGAGILVSGVIAVLMFWFFYCLPLLILLSYLGRKLKADIEMRIGPNRSSPFGIFQFFADFFKAVIKRPSVDEPTFKIFILLIMILIFSFVGFANVPISSDWVLSDSESGLLWVLLALFFPTICFFVFGYMVGKPWALISVFRLLILSGAVFGSLILSLLSIILISGSASLVTVVNLQGGGPWNWNLFHSPGAFLSAITMFVSLLVWQGEAPFGPFWTGYSKEEEISSFGQQLFLYCYYLNMLFSSSLFVAIYLGGWHVPFSVSNLGRASNLVEVIFHTTKVLLVVVLRFWSSRSLPQVRQDTTLNVVSRFLVPVGFSGVFLTMFWLVLFNGHRFGDFF